MARKPKHEQPSLPESLAMVALLGGLPEDHPVEIMISRRHEQDEGVVTVICRFPSGNEEADQFWIPDLRAKIAKGLK